MDSMEKLNRIWEREQSRENNRLKYLEKFAEKFSLPANECNEYTRGLAAGLVMAVDIMDGTNLCPSLPREVETQPAASGEET